MTTNDRLFSGIFSIIVTGLAVFFAQGLTLYTFNDSAIFEGFTR